MKQAQNKDDLPKKIIQKEATIFKVDDQGKLIPEVIAVEIYDRKIEDELAEEAIILMDFIQRSNAHRKVANDDMRKSSLEVDRAKKSYENEKDESKKPDLRKELAKVQDEMSLKVTKNQIMLETLQQKIKECRENIKKLNEEKAKQMKVEYIKAIPCNIGESYKVFKEGKKCNGEVIDKKGPLDWIDYLIMDKVIEPKYDEKEVALIKKDYKLAYRDALSELSGWKVKDYRDVISEQNTSEKKISKEEAGGTESGGEKDSPPEPDGSEALGSREAVPVPGGSPG